MLVDTSVWIDYFNGYTSPEAERLTRAISDDEPIALPEIVWTEILLGLRTETDAVRIQTHKMRQM
jgi:predicted nucleic acid-binding protein